MDQEQTELSEKIFNSSSLVLAEHGGVAPVFFIVKDKGLNPIVGVTDFTIQELANQAVNTAHEMNADAIILVCEQWMIKMDKNDERLKDYIDGNKRPSESSLAEEYLTLTHMTKVGEASSLIGKIHTSPNGVKYVRESSWINDTVTNMITPWAEWDL